MLFQPQQVSTTEYCIFIFNRVLCVNSHSSYLGMTVHWVDPTTLKHCKAALCCIRVIGRHTYDVLAEKIEHFHSSYGLARKVTAI